MSADDTFLEQFEATTWPLEQWHHRQHIKVAYMYLCRYPLGTASIRIREKIKAFNAAKQVPDGLSMGYHETMTQAWLQLVHFSLCEYGPAESADAFYESNPQLSQKKTLRFFYTRERFMTLEGKNEFLSPDVTPLPQSKKQFKPTG